MVQFAVFDRDWDDVTGPCTALDKWSFVHVLSGAVACVLVECARKIVSFECGAVLAHVLFVGWEGVEALMVKYKVNFPAEECELNKLVDVFCCIAGFWIVRKLRTCPKDETPKASIKSDYKSVQNRAIIF
jgi:hypothetical protein